MPTLASPRLILGKLLWAVGFLYCQVLLIMLGALSWQSATTAAADNWALSLLLIPNACCALGSVGLWRAWRAPASASPTALRIDIGLLLLGCAGALSFWTLLSITFDFTLYDILSFGAVFFIPPITLAVYELHQRYRFLPVKPLPPNVTPTQIATFLAALVLALPLTFLAVATAMTLA
jgi:hypothetical protein